MNPVWFEMIIAAVLVAAAITLVTWFLRYKSSRSDRRMYNMLQRVGVDPKIIEEGDQDAIMMAVRRRCQKCQAEDVCERWLAGQLEGENSFCPNANVFRTLAVSH